MNILHLVLTNTWGGGANQIQNLCNHLADIAPDCKNHLLTIKGSELEQRMAYKKSIQLHVIPMVANLDPRAVYKLISVCKNEKIDLIHIHGSTAMSIAVLAQNIRKLPPFVFSKKTSFPIKNRSFSRYKYNHPNLQNIFCVSEKTREVIAESIKDHSKLVTIYHGTNLDMMAEKAPFQLKEKLGLKSKVTLVGTIANHTKPKDLHTWIAVIDEIVNKRKLKNFHFVEFGSFSEITRDLKRKVRKLELEEYVTFMGFVPNASIFTSQFDISLMTSKSEGIPQFIYESFYQKVPVVSTNVGGIPEIIEDDVNGMLSNPYQAQCLADKLIALSCDKVLGEKFVERSYKKLIENFTTNKMAERTLAEYKKVLYGKN